jgi:hypothetical protein
LAGTGQQRKREVHLIFEQLDLLPFGDAKKPAGKVLLLFRCAGIELRADTPDRAKLIGGKKRAFGNVFLKSAVQAYLC